MKKVNSNQFQKTILIRFPLTFKNKSEQNLKVLVFGEDLLKIEKFKFFRTADEFFEIFKDNVKKQLLKKNLEVKSFFYEFDQKCQQNFNWFTACNE